MHQPVEQVYDPEKGKKDIRQNQEVILSLEEPIEAEEMDYVDVDEDELLASPSSSHKLSPVRAVLLEKSSPVRRSPRIAQQQQRQATKESTVATTDKPKVEVCSTDKKGHRRG